MNEPHGTHKTIWLHMLAEGGYCTAAELSKIAKVERIDGVLYHMERRGFIRKMRHEGRKNGRGYGVTPACKVPQWVTVNEVLAASGNLMQQEEL